MLLEYYDQFLVRDAFVRTNRRAVAMLFVRLSACPFVCLGRACIVIIRCTLVRIQVYNWIVQCSGHPDTKACPPTANRFFSSTWKRGGVWTCKLGKALNAINDK